MLLIALRDCTDQQLLSRIKCNDEYAFVELYHRYSHKISAVTSSALDKDLAQEIVQEIFSDLWERRHSLSIHIVSHYLLVAAKYQIRSYKRRDENLKTQRRRYAYVAKNHEEGTQELIDLHDLAEALEDGMRTLPEKTQLVFRRSRFEGKSISEIANSLQLSEKAIKYHISKSIRMLRFRLHDFLFHALLIFVLYEYAWV